MANGQEAAEQWKPIEGAERVIRVEQWVAWGWERGTNSASHISTVKQYRSFELRVRAREGGRDQKGENLSDRSFAISSHQNSPVPLGSNQG